VSTVPDIVGIGVVVDTGVRDGGLVGVTEGVAEGGVPHGVEDEVTDRVGRGVGVAGVGRAMMPPTPMMTTTTRVATPATPVATIEMTSPRTLLMTMVDLRTLIGNKVVHLYIQVGGQSTTQRRVTLSSA
jgi:hypothetical protein